MIKDLKKREGVVRRQSFNTDPLRWMHMELGCKSSARNTGSESMYFELYTACVLGFFYLLRISELEALKWGDISVDIRDGRN